MIDPAELHDVHDEAFTAIAKQHRELTRGSMRSWEACSHEATPSSAAGASSSATSRSRKGGDFAVAGIVDGAGLSPGDAVKMAAHLLVTLDRGGGTPILVPVDTEAQLWRALPR